MRVELWTDGSGTTRGNPGGWAYVLRAVDAEGVARKKITASGYTSDGTSQRMELMALLEGLRSLKRRSNVRVYTDSQYVIKGFTEGRVVRWKQKGWVRNANGPEGRYKKPVANRDLWEPLSDEVAKHEVTFEWVKGHSDVKLNERCDELAGEARRLAIEEGAEDEQRRLVSYDVRSGRQAA